MTSPKTPRTVTRSSSDRKIAGVAAGLARYFDVDPILVRVGFAVASLLSGAGLLAYVLLWAFVPRDDQVTAAVA
jgi:phage shock protein PspC (stress-responsive transcriptional regulator)